jgi:protein-disulfide isomerase/rhodanese-related sulfurtransferase
MRKTGLLALSVLGLFDSLYLWWVYTSPSRSLACLGTGCDVARASSYSHLAGIPTPAFGAVMYGALILLVFGEAAWAGPVGVGRLRMAMAGISAVGFGASLYLSWIEAFVLRSWCVWCVVSAASTTGIFVLAALELWRPGPLSETGEKLAALRRHLVVVVAGIVLGVPAFFVLSRSEESPPTAPPPAEVLSERLIRPDSHVFGNSQATVTVVEFADFQCPFCGDAERAARQVRQEFGGKIRFVFRQFPLKRIHEYAEKAAEASECAAQQGKFWQSVDELYDHQTQLTVPDLEGYARDMGLDSTRFDRCLTSGEMAARVQQDVADGQAVGVSRTPTFFIDGRKIEGAMGVVQFSQLLNQELVAHGTPPVASPSPGEAHNVPQEAMPPRTEVSTQGTQPSKGLLSGSGTNVFSSFQGSGCSEKEAAERQPALIPTSQARRLFEGDHKALFVDVRPAKEYGSAYIRGAINVPSDKIAQRVKSLPKDRTIVLYESGRSRGAANDVCAASLAAGRYLLEHGYPAEHVLVYKGGLQAWEEAGLPVRHAAPSGR